MRLFGKVNSTIDRFDRAEWLSGPFDMAFTSLASAVPLFLKSRIRSDLTVQSNIRTDLTIASTPRSDLTITSRFAKR